MTELHLRRPGRVFLKFILGDDTKVRYDVRVVDDLRQCSARADTLRPCVCQEGTIDILDVGASERLESVAAHSGPVWSLAALPDGSGFVSGSADHNVKFWEWEIVTETAQRDAGCARSSNMPVVMRLWSSCLGEAARRDMLERIDRGVAGRR